MGSRGSGYPSLSLCSSGRTILLVYNDGSPLGPVPALLAYLRVLGTYYTTTGITPYIRDSNFRPRRATINPIAYSDSLMCGLQLYTPYYRG